MRRMALPWPAWAAATPSSTPLCDGGRGARPKPRRFDGREAVVQQLMGMKHPEASVDVPVPLFGSLFKRDQLPIGMVRRRQAATSPINQRE